MIRGKTIQIYLTDGNPRGIKECDIKSGILRATLIPRNELKKIKRELLSQPGIYFLFTKKEDELYQFEVYIGEAEDTFKRIDQHDKRSDTEFWQNWNYAVCFISTKHNINKAHVKFLEYFCVDSAKRADRAKLENTTAPNEPTLTPQERDFSLILFDEIKTLLGTLGYNIFDEIKRKKTLEDIFYCKGKDAIATGSLTEEGFVVYKDSKANLKEVRSARSWLINRRGRLIKEGILIREGNVLKFAKDFVFSSPSAAAGVVLARRANGWLLWKNKDEKTLDLVKRVGRGTVTR